VGSELTSRVRVVRVERTREDVDWLAGRLTEVFDGARSVLVPAGGNELPPAVFQDVEDRTVWLPDEVALVRDGIDHGQVCAEGPQRAVRTFRIVLSVGGGSFTRLSHALHIDVDQGAKLGDELRDVDAGAAIDGRRIFAGQDGHVHGLIVPQRRPRWGSSVAVRPTD